MDGNQRVALLATYSFLSINGLRLEAPETETAETIDGVAAGLVTETALARWLAAHVTPI